MISRVVTVFLLVVSLGGLACDQTSLEAREQHVLDRIGYGPDAWSRQRIRKLGIEGYIDEQLHPEQLDDSALEARLRDQYSALSMSLPQLYKYYDNLPPLPSKTDVRLQLSRAKVLRAIHSKRQLEQVLVDFWFNYFNVDARREIAEWAVVPYERDVIRPRVLGRFEDLLRAVARHPAMLEYLDNAENFREGFVRDGKTWGLIGVRVAAVDMVGWDHHHEEAAELPISAALLAQALDAFVTDLGAEIDRTLVLVLSEFGRRAAENGSGGTEHGRGGALLAIGGGVRGGRVLLRDGRWPGLGASQLVDGRDLAVTTDFRDTFAEVLRRHMGLSDLAPIFPGYSVSTTRFPGLLA